MRPLRPTFPLLALAVSLPIAARALPAQASQVPQVPQAPHAEQRTMGTERPVNIGESFDGLGVGFTGPQGTSSQRNPSDNSLAVGRDHIMQTVNTRVAIFTKAGAKYAETGKVLYGPVASNNVFRGFGGACEANNNGDVVVRYDQLVDRWLLVMPIFLRVAPSTTPPGPRAAPLFIPPAPAPGDTARPRPAPSPEPADGKYAMCYAVSETSDPLGTWYRYEFERPLFPDYPRPAVWPDGWYTPTSTGDDVIEKHVCVAERSMMLIGADATEQCVIVPDVNFLNTSDLDGRMLPPPGAPNIIVAAGGTQLRGVVTSNELQFWQMHVDWADPTKTKLTGPARLAVAPYAYLCGGQLTKCVPQPGTDVRLDAQGDKIMPRFVYRRFRTHESLVAVHSVTSAAGAGGVRWYEFRVGYGREITLRQQGTFAPDSAYRWMASPAIDQVGNIGFGYSYGSATEFVGQRFAGRTPLAPTGSLDLAEAVLVRGGAAQTSTLRWQDYTQTAVDPSDDCTVWYVGDYLKAGATAYSTRIGAFRMPGCQR